MKVKFYKSINAFACNLNCRNGYKEDRKAGAMYGAFKHDGKLMGAGEFSRLTKTCIYCGDN